MTDEQIEHVAVGAPPKRLNGPVVLSEYDADWPAIFAKEQARISSVLGDKALMIEHVGSTSVPGLAAKPIIDILLVVDRTPDEKSYVPELESVGYVLRVREPTWHEHRLFKGPDADVNLHVFSRGDAEIERMLVFRDWLRTHGEDRDLYLRTKRDLASKTWKYTQNYADAKSAVVNSVLKKARSAR
ncbi:MAG TPA: GrpB family protein [Nitrososphaerales archaeon]|nr:GrpB family protein [Nitrososphaerales archaeon]